jgi:hypothetical protein
MFGYPGQVGTATGSIHVNGSECCRYSLPEWDNTVRCPKPPLGGEVLELNIENDFTFVPDEVFGNGDTCELGAGVVRVWQE